MISEQDVQKLKNFISRAKSIVIVSHKSPDGDSVGSSMALYYYLKNAKINATVSVCHPDQAPGFIRWADSENIILNFEHHLDKVQDEIRNADLVICLDFNDLSRVGAEMEKVLLTCSAPKIMIDHHLKPNLEQFDLCFSFPDRSSTCELLMELMLLLFGKTCIDPVVGERLYLGIVTDTGSFRFNSVRERTHELAAMLLNIGVNHTQVHESTFDDNTLERLQLRSFILSQCLEVWSVLNTAVLYLTQENATRYRMQKGDTEGLVNVALSIQGIDRAAFFKEEDGHVRISFRSKSNVDVNEIASNYYNGGGHRQAAGGRFEGSLREAVDEFKRVLNHE
jgi:phosphoesterase RecJ-like protein